jgi:hypothetical protein
VISAGAVGLVAAAVSAIAGAAARRRGGRSRRGVGVVGGVGCERRAAARAGVAGRRARNAS